jgi:hypothetical protein
MGKNDNLHRRQDAVGNPRWRGRGALATFFIGVILVYLTASCKGGGGAPPDSENPTNVAVTGGITPGQEVSGTLTLSATAQDNCGTIQKIEFLVSSPDEVMGCTAPGPKPSNQTFSCNWDSTGVANGAHSIKAKAHDPTGNTSESTPVNFTVNNVQAPPAPTNVQVQGGDGQATLTWNPAPGATSYNLYMASQAGVTKSNYSTKPDGMKHPNVTSPYNHTGLTNGKTYYFVRTAVNAAGESLDSTEVSATPTATPSQLLGSSTDPANTHIPDIAVPTASASDLSPDNRPNGTGLLTSRTRIVVNFTDSATVGQVNALLQSLNATIIGTIPGTKTVVISISDTGDFTGLQNALTTLQSQPLVLFPAQDVVPGPMRVSVPSNAQDPNVRDVSEDNPVGKYPNPWLLDLPALQWNGYRWKLGFGSHPRSSDVEPL